MTKPLLSAKNDIVLGRQIALAAAFLLPASKLLEAPSILAQYAGGDIILPALFHFLLQAGVLAVILFAASRSKKSLFERLERLLGKGVSIVYILYALYFVYAAILPLLDLEKFVYAAFFDTSPTTFTFVFFFPLCAFICVKGLKSLGRAADISLFLFLLPFLALIAMSFAETDFSHLLPLFGSKFGGTMSAFTKTTPHFSDAILLLPLIGNYRYEKRDGMKIMAGYGVGALLSLFFFAVFFGVYSSIAPREHYAFAKIAQYFPALSIIGRADLLFVYLLTVVLLIFTCMPLQYTTDLFCHACHIQKRVLPSAVLNLALFFFVFYCNKYYNSFYAVISGKLGFVFWIFADILPLLLLLLPKYSEGEKETQRVPAPHKKEKRRA